MKNVKLKLTLYRNVKLPEEDVGPKFTGFLWHCRLLLHKYAKIPCVYFSIFPASAGLLDKLFNNVDIDKLLSLLILPESYRPLSQSLTAGSVNLHPSDFTDSPLICDNSCMNNSRSVFVYPAKLTGSNCATFTTNYANHKTMLYLWFFP